MRKEKLNPTIKKLMLRYDICQPCYSDCLETAFHSRIGIDVSCLISKTRFKAALIEGIRGAIMELEGVIKDIKNT